MSLFGQGGMEGLIAQLLPPEFAAVMEKMPALMEQFSRTLVNLETMQQQILHRIKGLEDVARGYDLALAMSGGNRGLLPAPGEAKSAPDGRALSSFPFGPLTEDVPNTNGTSGSGSG